LVVFKDPDNRGLSGSPNKAAKDGSASVSQAKGRGSLFGKRPWQLYLPGGGFETASRKRPCGGGFTQPREKRGKLEENLAPEAAGTPG